MTSDLAEAIPAFASNIASIIATANRTASLLFTISSSLSFPSPYTQRKTGHGLPEDPVAGCTTSAARSHPVPKLLAEAGFKASTVAAKFCEYGY